jgi:Ca-activated chloride channel family protein
VDLLVCLDVSNSMHARDLQPDRLERARLELQDLVSHLGSDRVGLILVAGEARRAAPLTADHTSFLALLAQASPSSLRQGGTDLASALELAVELLESAPSTQRNVLLLSDGEDRAGLALEQADACREAGIVVHTLGIGTALGGKITLQDADGQEFYLSDATGKDVLTRLDRGSLDAIATATGGSAIALDGEVGALRTWYEQVLLPEARDAARANPDLERAPRFQWPLALALMGAFLGLAGFGRRRG